MKLQQVIDFSSIPRLSSASLQGLFSFFESSEIFIVGGAARDVLLHKPVEEIDLSTPLSPSVVMERLPQSVLRTYKRALAHGTVHVKVKGERYEITSWRQDIKTDGRHAQVTFTDQMDQDAKRRDFTVNAIYMTPKGEVITPLSQSLEDLKERRLHFIGEPTKRMEEDSLRLLRYFRFLKDFPNDLQSFTLNDQIQEQLTRLSPERVVRELRKTLDRDLPDFVLQRMKEIQVLNILFPKFRPSQYPDQPQSFLWWLKELGPYINGELPLTVAEKATLQEM